MAEKPVRHRYPIWLSWPLEIAACLIIVLTTWNYLGALLQTIFQQWPETLANLGAIPYAKPVALLLSGPIPAGPVPWERLNDLLSLNIRAFVLFFLAALLRSLLPRLRLQEKGLQVRRGLGWATIPWDRVTQVESMTLPGDRLVLLIQGRRWRVGPWFRLYSLLWGAGLKKGIVVAWHISHFDVLADGLVSKLTEIYGEQGVGLVVDDTAYSLVYALMFLPGATWSTLFAPRQVVENAYAYPKPVHVLARVVVGLLLVLAAWRYVGVWWRFFVNRFPDLANALRWPVLGTLLSTFGPPDTQTSVDSAYSALVLAQVSMVLVLVAVIFFLNMFPDWLLGIEGPSVQIRRKWVPIPWEAIHAIRETAFAGGRGGVILLQVKRSCLTFWHSLYSLFYGAGLRRGVLFTSLLPGYEQMRERVQVGVVRAHEGDAHPPERPILVEHGEAEFLQMLREPLATLRRWGKHAEPEPMAGGLLKKPGYTPVISTDLPWEAREESEGAVSAEAESLRQETRKATGAALALASFAFVLVLLEEWLFPVLSRPLALFSLAPVAPGRGIVLLVLRALMMALLVLAEWPLAALLMSTIAEMYDQPGEFQQALSLYPRIQSPRLVPVLLLLPLGATGVIQPLFLLWWCIGLVWGAVLLWLAGRELYGWRGLGNALLLAGYVLFQGLVLLVYFLVR